MLNFITKLLDLFDNYILKQPKMKFEYSGFGTYPGVGLFTNLLRGKPELNYLLHVRIICLKNYPQYVEKIEFCPNKGKSFFCPIYGSDKPIKFKDSKPIEIYLDISKFRKELPYKKIFCHSTSGHRYKMCKEDTNRLNNDYIKKHAQSEQVDKGSR